ncbi:MAG: thiosulfate sulfurtransferase [Solirubrobacterales bacterium]|nr:thiosulfate sulfurtransferase [Solirubrobacterales bacterium]
MGPTHRTVSPAEVRERLRAGSELALLDVRTLEEHRAGHLLWAAHVAPDQLDRVPALVPRRATPIVLAEVAADRAATVAGELHARGYSNVSVLAGGNAGWVADGGALHAKLCVPSKGLAEQARRVYETPEVSAEELAALQDGPAGPPLVLDVRTAPEYARGTIPGAVSCPGGELVLRAFDLVDPDRPVVVTCAGRTRAIFGAQSLIDAGLPNPVSFLTGGTSAWTASGRALEVGAQRLAPEPGRAGAALAREAAGRLAERFALRIADRAGLVALLAEATDHTTYLIDPRTPAPPTAHPLARAVPAGQLVEAVDEFLGVLGARVVLLDDPPFTRAVPIARWLEQLGTFDVIVAAASDAPDLAGDPAAPPVALAGAEDVEAWSIALPDRLASEPGVAFRHFPALVA